MIRPFTLWEIQKNGAKRNDDEEAGVDLEVLNETVLSKSPSWESLSRKKRSP
jgi:tRNA A-37 threonylcarbamoyl transferase component Bud32